MLHSKFVALNLVKAMMVALLFFSCLPSSNADEVDTLIQKLKDKDRNVRWKAAWTLGTRENTRAVEPLIAALKDEDSHVRFMAAEALGAIKDTRAVEPLIAALKDEDSHVRGYAATVLGAIKDIRAVEPLIAALKDENQNVRETAAWALITIKDPRALIAALKSEKTYVRRKAVEALGEIGDKRAINPLIENLTDMSSNKMVAEILSNMGWEPQSDSDRIHFLIAQHRGGELKKDWNLTKDVLLKDVVSHYRWTIENALYAFIAIGKIEIIPVLIETLNTAGNKAMAEAYLNCGHSGLADAAKDWARRHGYTISRGAGTAQVTWGSW